MTKEIWIVEGRVTCLDAHPTAQLGDTEWQFSDGPAGDRGSSSDYLSLEEGLRDHTGSIFHFQPLVDPYMNELVDRTAPRWAWDIIDETLRADSQSSAFSRDLRDQINAANAAMIVACERADDQPIGFEEMEGMLL